MFHDIFNVQKIYITSLSELSDSQKVYQFSVRLSFIDP